MIIRMLKTENGSVDGIRTAAYEVGSEYDLGATPGEIELAKAFVDADLAEEVGAAPAEKPSKPKK